MSDPNTSSSGTGKRQNRPTDYKVKAVLLCDFLNGVPVVDSARRLRAAFGEDTISNECANYYVKKFKNGNLDIGEPLQNVQFVWSGVYCTPNGQFAVNFVDACRLIVCDLMHDKTT
ncbi:hypothetical protein M3Y99_00688100 [Aphelenchoides fujianensis]|nr:hypothetical protein M3Y99_00688100 [Aphelenchoides fujianensis]